MINASNESVSDDAFIDRAWSACLATLQRSPIDRFEAAVTLEAHHGVAAMQALAIGRRFAEQSRFASLSFASLPKVPEPAISGSAPTESSIATRAIGRGAGTFARLLGEVVFMVSVLIVGFWVSSMAGDLGIRSVDHAWRVALPASLGAQWFLRRRYLSGEQGLGRLRRELPVAAVTLAVVAGAGLLGEGWLGAVLGVLWTAGFLISRRGWSLPQFALLLAAVVAHYFGVSAVPLLAGAAVVATTVAMIGVATSLATTSKASPWHAGVLAAGVGAGLGALLVVEPEFVWTVRVPLPILTVVPSLLGSFWGAAHMSGLWDVLPSRLRSAPLSPQSGTAGGAAVQRLVLSSVLRIAGLSFVGSVAVVWWAGRAQHPGTTTKRLLLAHALLAVAGLCVSLLEGFGRAGQALCCVVVGVGFALLGPQWHVAPFPPASRILLAAAATTFTSLAFLLYQIRDPGRSIAAGI